jgi:type IV pilus assembly protein PilM
MPPSLNVKLGRRSGNDVVGLDIQPGLVAAVRARVNGAILVERAGALELPANTVREGDVVDETVLAETLRELFSRNRLGKQVRVGVANQRTVMRTIELPPITDAKELDAAVRFRAQDQIPMPLSHAVLDYQPLGVVDTPAGPRQHIMVVAAQRDMIERLLSAVRGAGLSPVGVDLSAFAMIRALHRADSEHEGRVLYANVDGLTNVAIAEGTVCRFTRVVGGGIEELAGELAERRGIPVTDARALLTSVDLRAPAAAVAAQPAASAQTTGEVQPGGSSEGLDATQPSARDANGSDQQAPTEPPAVTSDAEAQAVLEHGIRAIAGEVRNSLDFYRSQGGGGEVSRVVLSGFALDFPGFAEALQLALGLDVHSETISMLEPGVAQDASSHRLAVAAGLATTEAPQ